MFFSIFGTCNVATSAFTIFLLDAAAWAYCTPASSHCPRRASSWSASMLPARRLCSTSSSSVRAVVVVVVESTINKHSFYLTGEVVTTIPTIGFNVETVDVHGLSMTVWDVGGRSGTRALWRHYYQNTQGLVYVLDANDTERIDDARAELARCVCFVYCHILVTQLLTAVVVDLLFFKNVGRARAQRLCAADPCQQDGSTERQARRRDTGASAGGELPRRSQMVSGLTQVQSKTSQ